MTYLILAILLILSGDLSYSLITQSRLKKWESQITREANGVRCGCEAFDRGKGETAILLIHGFGDSPAVYQKFATVLSEAGFACRAMRLPCFAQDMVKYSQSKRQDWVEAVNMEIQQLRQGHSSVFIIAHSLGGAVVVQYLLDHPSGIDGLILLAPLINVSNHRSPILSPQAWHRIAKYLLPFSRVVEDFFPPDVQDQSFKDDLLCDRFIPRRIYDEIFLLSSNINGRAGEINVPLLIYLSSSDKVIDNRAVERFYQQTSSTHKKLIYLHRCGHLIQIDYEWREVVEQILAFTPSQQEIPYPQCHN